jgi:hypothetical protein
MAITTESSYEAIVIRTMNDCLYAGCGHKYPPPNHRTSVRKLAFENAANVPATDTGYSETMKEIGRQLFRFGTAL